MIKRITRKCRSLILRYKGAKINETIQCPSSFFSGDARYFSCGRSAYLMQGSKLIISSKGKEIPGLIIGDFFFMNHYSIIDCHYRIEIGARVQIGPHCYITDFDHDLKVNVNQPFHRMNETVAAVQIGENAWIGAGVIILKGVTIGKNSVIAAGSVVTTDVPDNVIAAGSPAKVIKLLSGNIDSYTG